nr:unnamed protein product [Callosobruchus analis]
MTTIIHKKRTKEYGETISRNAEPSNEFHNFCRMWFTAFELLLKKVGRIISKKNTIWSDCLLPKVRLAITLHFLASGELQKLTFSLQSIQSNYIKIVQEVCVAIYQALKDHIKV